MIGGGAVLERVAEGVQVWTSASGVPQTLVRAGVRYRVTDRPTRWLGRDDAWDFGPAVPDPQYPDRRLSGLPALWRFQATPVSGADASIVVDVVATARGWVLLGVVR